MTSNYSNLKLDLIRNLGVSLVLEYVEKHKSWKILLQPKFTRSTLVGWLIDGYDLLLNHVTDWRQWLTRELITTNHAVVITNPSPVRPRL